MAEPSTGDFTANSRGRRIPAPTRPPARLALAPPPYNTGHRSLPAPRQAEVIRVIQRATVSAGQFFISHPCGCLTLRIGVETKIQDLRAPHA